MRMFRCRRILGMLALLALSGLVLTSEPPGAAASTTTERLPAQGGVITVTEWAPSSGWCVWSSLPKVPNFNRSIRCNKGKVARSATIEANISPQAERYTLTLTVIGKIRAVDYVNVVVAAMPFTAHVVPNIFDAQLYKDTFAISFDGLPPLPDVYAIPGDSVYLEAFVTEPGNSTPKGWATFYVNASVVPSCVYVPVVRAHPKSEAVCAYTFASGGTAAVGERYIGADFKSQGAAVSDMAIATPDEVAAIDQECAEAASMTYQC